MFENKSPLHYCSGDLSYYLLIRTSKPPLFAFSQSVWAFWNWGELGSRIPVGVNLISPCALGSGKLGSPRERMHIAYFSNCASVGPDEAEELEPAAALDRVVVVLA
jgi:hypothetical protein